MAIEIFHSVVHNAGTIFLALEVASCYEYLQKFKACLFLVAILMTQTVYTINYHNNNDLYAIYLISVQSVCHAVGNRLFQPFPVSTG